GDVNYFLKRADDVRATEVSSHSWDEDSFAGIVRAANELDWGPYDSRYLLFFSDAGSLRAADPASSTGYDAEQVRRILLEKNIAPFIFDLLTPAGRQDHDFAAAQYRTVSDALNIGTGYFPIEGGSVEAFGNTLDQAVEQF